MLTERSKKFLKKYQSGGVVQQLPNLPLGQVQSMTVPAIQQAQQTQALQFAKVPNMLSQVPQGQGFQAPPAIQNQSTFDMVGQTASSIPVLGMFAAAGYGGYQIGKSIKQKRNQKRLDKEYKKDIAERKQDIRNNEYVNTPYSFQEGGFNLDLQNTNQDIQAQWEEYYRGLNQQNIDRYKQTLQQGVSTAGQAASQYVGLATKLASSGTMQEGGAANTDIYSTDFDANAFLGTENSEQEMKVNQNQELLKWVFEDMDDYSPIQEEYENYGSQSQNVNPDSMSADGVIAEIGQSESGGDYSVINPTTGTTGKYQFHPKYWATQIGEFMGIDGTNDEIMSEFKNSPKTQEAFMNHVVNDIYKPEIKKLKPYADKYGFTEAQMVRFLHYRGLADTKKRLVSGNFEVSQAEKEKYNNPDILSYIKK